MAITFEQVNYIYFPHTPFEHKALFDINIKFEDGKFYALVGHTGSGKSTLVQNINALLLPTFGEVHIDDLKVTSKKKDVNFRLIRRKCGLVFQFPESQLFEENVLKDVMFGPKNFGLKEEEAKEKAINALKLVGLDESYFEKSPFDLSGGQKRRVAIAGVLAMDPDVLILDEPTAGLDPVGSSSIMSMFKKLNEMGKTIILITHDMNVVYEYATNAIVLKEGKVVFDGYTDELFANTKKLEEFNLKEPDLVRFTRLAKEKGFKLNENTNSIEELVNELSKEVL